MKPGTARAVPVILWDDVPTDGRDLLGWYEDRGWTGVDCVWKDMNRVIVIGTRPPDAD